MVTSQMRARSICPQHVPVGHRLALLVERLRPLGLSAPVLDAVSEFHLATRRPVALHLVPHEQGRDYYEPVVWHGEDEGLLEHRVFAAMRDFRLLFGRSFAHFLLGQHHVAVCDGIVDKVEEKQLAVKVV